MTSQNLKKFKLGKKLFFICLYEKFKITIFHNITLCCRWFNIDKFRYYWDTLYWDLFVMYYSLMFNFICCWRNIKNFFICIEWVLKYGNRQCDNILMILEKMKIWYKCIHNYIYIHITTECSIYILKTLL